MENIPYGDLKRQLFFFKTEYTGYDALFIDHFTNTRFTRDQETEADLLALRIMHELGLLNQTNTNFNQDIYRSTLKTF